MKNIEILKHYKISDLRRLARGKISEIVGVNSEKILINLSKVLGNYESIRNNIEFRKPPVNSILEVLYEALDHMIKYEDLKSLVIKKIKEYQNLSKEIDLDDSDKNFRLYATILNAAWEYEKDLVPSEANLLRVLRKELDISRKDHMLIMAHPQIKRLFFDEEMYRKELEFLSQEGIILVYKTDIDDYFVLSDETKESIQELWGIELIPEQFNRLLIKLSKAQLSSMLKSFKLYSSGTSEEQINRIILSEIKPSEFLCTLSTSQLSSILKKINLTQVGTKEEKVMKIIDYFKSDKDMEELKPEKEKEIIVEERILSDEKIIDFLSYLTTQQLRNILEKLNLIKSGQKNILIDRLVNSQFNEDTILDILNKTDIEEISKKFSLRTNRKKTDLIKEIIFYYHQQIINESKVPTKHLFNYYNELSCQDNRIYFQNNISEEICATTIGLDFERVTNYIFKNVFKLETRTQRFGREEPDGIVRDDDGNIFLYECKTVLNPPYKLPISHRLQIRNYIQEILKTKDGENLRGYIIISHSFPKKIKKKISAIKSPLNVPICVIEAKDLAAFAKKWETDYPVDTFPIKRILKYGKISLRDFEQVLQ